MITEFGVRSVCAGMIAIVIAGTLPAQTLELPPRPKSALGGREFARGLATLSLADREAAVDQAFAQGNIPDFLRKLEPVTVRNEADSATYYVTRDYLAVGSDADFVRMPLSPTTAQKLADRLGGMLPTSKMVDDIYAQATVKLAPTPIPPSPAMTTMAVFLDHNDLIQTQRGDQPLTALVAGHKKDVVITPKIFSSGDRVAIYGWHKPDGKPIQPLYTGHRASWVDYSHGVRLVSRAMTVNGKALSADVILGDPRLAPLLSREGPLRQTRYSSSARANDVSRPPVLTADHEASEEMAILPGVRVVINRPKPQPDGPVHLIFYALPNGNTIEQTIGKMPAAGEDWRYGIQHIGAQTRFLRAAMPDRAIVVAYLENELKSWPAWRKAHGDAPIAEILDTVIKRAGGPNTRVALAGHSGGGSLICGYMNTVARIPDRIERIAFLDANYAYDTALYLDKLVDWLKASDRHFLSVLAYDDARAILNGKSFVSESGGTWGRSHLMVRDLGARFTLTPKHTSEMQRFDGLARRIEFRLIENPDRKIFHTVLVEKNGFIESMVSGTGLAGKDYVFFGEPAYSRFVLGR